MTDDPQNNTASKMPAFNVHNIHNILQQSQIPEKPWKVYSIQNSLKNTPPNLAQNFGRGTA